MSLTLTLRQQPSDRLDLSAVRADAVVGCTLDQVRRLPVRAFSNANDEACLGDWFDVHGSTEQPRVVIDEDGGRLDGLGFGQRHGTLIVEGNAGDFVGREMRGGAIVVRGHGGHFAGAKLRGGTLHIAGGAGDYAAGAPRGERTGMRGGVLWIGGDVGRGCGLRQRRGLVVVQGAAAGRLAEGMIAGTIVLGRDPGAELGWGMRRGTVVLMRMGADGEEREPGGTTTDERRFSRGYPVDRGVIDLLGRALVDADAEYRALTGLEPCDFGGRLLSDAELQTHRRAWQRRIGDRTVGGQGEIWNRLQGHEQG